MPDKQGHQGVSGLRSEQCLDQGGTHWMDAVTKSFIWGHITVQIRDFPAAEEALPWRAAT